LSIYTKDQLLALPREKQKEWVESQDWFDESKLGEKLDSSPIVALSVDIEDELSERIEYFSDYNNINFFKSGLVTEKRFKELENGASFTNEEKGKFRDVLIDEAIGNFDVLEARWIEIAIDKINLGVVFTTTNHPLVGLDYNFLGIFKSVQEVEKRMQETGTIVDNFLA
jgi:hypothetical protein